MISEWTDNFNQEKKIGEGAFGSVFSCVVVFPDEIEGLQEKRSEERRVGKECRP